MESNNNEIEDILMPYRISVQQQGDIVRNLKATKADEAEIKQAVTELKARKKLLENKEHELTSKESTFDRSKLEDLLKQKFFYDQSFSIYGGVNGLYDFGPMGCSIKANLLSEWRKFFILQEHLLEVECSILTPEAVLKASGHVERFTDFMVKDMSSGECFRADHLVESGLQNILNSKKADIEEKAEIKKILTQLDNYGQTELQSVITKFNLRSPTTNSELSAPQKFNLMFESSIGPTGQYKGYLRPETAQGIFVNFKRLLQFNQGRLPFGAAQIGQAFRNEINPRSGLLRVREFTMAEIEYFVDPSDKSYSSFSEVADLGINLYSACDQMSGKSPKVMKIGDALSQGIIANETLAYFLGRIHIFLVMVGIQPDRLRFRQHMSNEMAHYACDCWDAECQTSYGWIECVGCADRACFDLSQHTKATGARLVAERHLDEPKTVQMHDCIPNKGLIGKEFKADAKKVIEKLASFTLEEVCELDKALKADNEATFAIDDKLVKLLPNMVQFKEYESKVHVEEIMPNVIEPSFGIGRIIYCIFEHNFHVRKDDEQRTFLTLPPIIAPYKCSLLPLSNQPSFAQFIRELSEHLTQLGVSHRVDSSTGSIGRRYARTDQLAIPYGITIDFDTVNIAPPSATLRERDSMNQIRVELTALPQLVSDLTSGILSWQDACQTYPIFKQQETGS